MKAKLNRLTRELYDARTPEARRRELSCEVAELRCAMLNTRDPLADMIAGSGESDEEDQ